MMNLVRSASFALASVALLSASLAAQTAEIAPGGTLSVALAKNVVKAFNAQNITVSYFGTGPIQRGEDFNVTGGTVDLATGLGSASTQGSMMIQEGGNTVALNTFALLSSFSDTPSYITADVVINGEDQGRFPVFQLAANLYTPPLSPGKYKSSAVEFTINPDFQSEFADYIPISGLDPNASLGVFDLKVKIRQPK